MYYSANAYANQMDIQVQLQTNSVNTVHMQKITYTKLYKHK